MNIAFVWQTVINFFFASGWGKDKFGKEGKYQVILKKVELPVVPSDTCKESLRKTALGKFFVLHNSFICAGGEAGEGNIVRFCGNFLAYNSLVSRHLHWGWRLTACVSCKRSQRTLLSSR